jgi:CRP-like cAMP-binding protein
MLKDPTVNSQSSSPEIRRGRKGIIEVQAVRPPYTQSYSVDDRSLTGNLLLDDLSIGEYAQFASHLEPVELTHGQVLTSSGRFLSHVYFPTTALVAYLVELEDGATVDVGMVGPEGVVNLGVFWGATRAGYTVIPVKSGRAFKMRAGLFRREVQLNDALFSSLMAYTSFSFTCSVRRTACNSLHSVKQRTASYLLGLRDYSRQDRFDITHEFIAGLLGVRRSGVTSLINEFSQSKILRTGRGHIEIIAPQELEHFACECYNVGKTELDRFRYSGIYPNSSRRKSASREH